MPLPQSISDQINGLARDGTSGATALAQHAATIVLQATDPQLEIPEADISSALTELTHALVKAQPAIAPILNLGNRILHAIHLESAGTELRSTIRGLAGAIVNQLETSNTRIALHAESLVKDGMVILTHSHSSAVRKSLVRIKESGRAFSVFCTESRPMNEGIDLAQELSRHDIPTTLIADAAMTSVLHNVQLVMVGADSVSLNGLVNKVGTSGLALGARERTIPMYALCGSEKFVPQAFVVNEKPRAAEELLPQSIAHVSVHNVYFDSTPLDRLAGIVSEEGILTLGDIRKTLTELESDFAIRPELLGPPFTSR